MSNMYPLTISPYNPPTGNGSRASISQLPEELLIRILRFTQYYGRYEYQEKMLWTDFNSTLATCRSIRSVAMAAPELWACVDFSGNEKWVQLCLTRAQGCSLDIIYGQNKGANSDLLLLLRSDLYRAIRIDWSRALDHKGYEDITACLASAMPLLKEMHLVLSPNVFQLGPDVLGGWTARITCLILEAVHILSNLSFPALRELALTSIVSSVDAIAHILLHSPALGILSVQNLTSIEAPTIHDWARQLIPIPLVLKSLWMMLWHDESWELFWRIPNPTQSFTLDIHQLTPERASRLLERFRMWSLRTNTILPPLTARFLGVRDEFEIRIGDPTKPIWANFRANSDVHEILAAWETSSSTHQTNHPFLSSTTRLVFESNGFYLDLHHRQHILDKMTDLGEVRLYRAYASVCDDPMEIDDYRDELVKLEAWVLSLAERGLRLKRLIFDCCNPNLEDLSQRLRTAGVVDSVTWIGAS
jgi:hypothetical protein